MAEGGRTPALAPIVEARGLTKVFQDGIAFKALDSIDLTIWPGEFTAIMGASGSGKSTLLHLLGALDRPTAGTLRVAGQDLVTLRDLDGFRGRTVGFVFQLHNLLPHLTALENVAIPMEELAMTGAERQARALALLQKVGLADRVHYRPTEMSGGQRQRVALARALANQPSILLADEPTGNLDTQSGQEVMALLRELNAEQQVTIVMVTHDPMLAIAARRVITLRDGRILEDRALTAEDKAAMDGLADSWLGRVLLART